MATGYSTTRLIIVATALGGLVLFVPYLGNRLASRGVRVAPKTIPRNGKLPPQDSDEFFAFVSALPSCQALEASFIELSNSGRELLEVAATSDAESLQQNLQQYQAAIRQTVDDYEVLADRIGREPAEAVYFELATEAEGFLRAEELVLPIAQGRQEEFKEQERKEQPRQQQQNREVR